MGGGIGRRAKLPPLRASGTEPEAYTELAGIETTYPPAIDLQHVAIA